MSTTRTSGLGRLARSTALLLALALAPTFAAGDGPISKDLRDEDSFRCASGIAERGDAKYAVQEKCGKPTSVDQGDDVWIYDFGPGQFVYYLTFLEGRLNRIQRGGYGQAR